jgi:pectin methylesterase-like acyl-CoA thioesterase
VVVDLQEQYYSGVNPVLDGATGVTLTDNTITGNTTGAAVQGDPSNSFVLKAIKNWWGTNVNAEIQAAVSPYVSFDPWYASAAMDTLDSAKPVINETKGTSYDTIQAAISDAASGDSIYVKAGTYRRT